MGQHLINEEDDISDDVITILIMHAPSNHEFFISCCGQHTRLRSQPFQLVQFKSFRAAE